MKKISFFSDKPNKTIKRLLFFAIILFAVMSFFGGILEVWEVYFVPEGEETFEEVPFFPRVCCFFSIIELLLLFLGKGLVSKVFGLAINVIKIALPIPVFNYLWSLQDWRGWYKFSLLGYFLVAISVFASFLYLYEIRYAIGVDKWNLSKIWHSKFFRVILVIALVLALERLSYCGVTKVFIRAGGSNSPVSETYSLEKEYGSWIAAYSKDVMREYHPKRKAVDKKIARKVKKILASRHALFWNGCSHVLDFRRDGSTYELTITFFYVLEIKAHGGYSSLLPFYKMWEEMTDLYDPVFGLED